MTGEIPMEHLPAALAARLDCPVNDCAGTVRLTLASNAPGDVAVWQCDSAASHEWHEDGSPRWGVEFAVEVVIGDVEVGSSPASPAREEPTPEREDGSQ